MASSVTRATSSRQPACAASSSMTSPWMRVESTSMTMRRLARRDRPVRCTATSTSCAAASAASSTRSASGSAPETDSSMQVTGHWARRSMRSMLAPAAAMRPAMPAMAAGWRVAPSTLTESRPRRRASLAVDPVESSTSMPRSSATLSTAVHIAPRVVPVPVEGPPVYATSTPKVSLPRMTTCSMSATATGNFDRTEKRREVTPGRSGPVSVIRRVRWSTSSHGTAPGPMLVKQVGHSGTGAGCGN